MRNLLLDGQTLASWLRDRNPTLASATARTGQARSALQASRLLPNPTLDLSVNNITVGHTNPPGISRSDTLNYGAGLSQLIELGKRGPRSEAAKLRLDSAKLDYVNVAADTMGRARYVIGRTIYLAQRTRVLEESRDNARHVAELEQTRLKNQALSGIDYDRILLELASLEAEIRRTQADYAGALAECQAVLLAPCDTRSVSETDLDAAAPIPPNAQTLSGAIEHRADLQALRAESAASRREATLAGRRAIPDVLLHVGYTHDNFTLAGDQANTLSVGVSIPLPLFDRGQHDRTRALGRSLELDQTRRALSVTASSDLESLWARKAALEKTLAVLESETLPRSAAVLESAQRAFDQGQFSLTDLLIARRADIAFRLNHSDTRFELFSVRNELRQVLGLDEQIARGKE